MGGGEYAELMAFMSIYESRSLRSASLRLGVTPSALSRTLRRLEDRLGLRLFNRTTRSVSPTEAGTLLYTKLAPAVEGLNQAVGDTLALRAETVGTIRLNLPRLAAELILLPHLPLFTTLHPGIKLELVIDDGLSDIIGKGFDAGIRFGNRLEQDWVAVRISPPWEAAVVGSPAYFERHPPPVCPQDLSGHVCLNYRWSTTGQLARWRFNSLDGEVKIDIDGQLVINDTGLLRDAAISGIGLICLPEPAVRAEISKGTLIRVLEDWCEPSHAAYIYHPNRHQTPPALRTLISFLQMRNS